MEAHIHIVELHQCMAVLQEFHSAKNLRTYFNILQLQQEIQECQMVLNQCHSDHKTFLLKLKKKKDFIKN